MVEIVDDQNEPGTQLEKELFKSGDVSLNKVTATGVSITHTDAATALEILKKYFHLFREQAAKEKTEADAYRVRIAELENKQFLLRATLDHRNAYNDTLERAARVTSTPDPFWHPSSQAKAPQPSTVPNESIPLQTYHITDSGVAHLRNMQCLEELDLEGNVLTDTGVIATISGNQSLQKLNLSWLRNVSDRSMVFVAENWPNLKFLDLSGTRVTGAGIRAFSGHMCLESLVLRSCYAFSWHDVERMMLGCPSLKSFVLTKSIIKRPIPERLTRILTLVDDLHTTLTLVDER
ncbi:hypothetical protein ACLB2K_018930 [Fragaria x ananassa]